MLLFVYDSFSLFLLVSYVQGPPSSGPPMRMGPPSGGPPPPGPPSYGQQHVQYGAPPGPPQGQMGHRGPPVGFSICHR